MMLRNNPERGIEIENFISQCRMRKVIKIINSLMLKFVFLNISSIHSSEILEYILYLLVYTAHLYFTRKKGITEIGQAVVTK